MLSMLDNSKLLRNPFLFFQYYIMRQLTIIEHEHTVTVPYQALDCIVKALAWLYWPGLAWLGWKVGWRLQKAKHNGNNRAYLPVNSKWWSGWWRWWFFATRDRVFKRVYHNHYHRCNEMCARFFSLFILGRQNRASFVLSWKNHLPFFLLTLDDFYTSKVRYLPKVKKNFPLLFVLLMLGVSLVLTHRAKNKIAIIIIVFFGYLITAKKRFQRKLIIIVVKKTNDFWTCIFLQL